MRMQIRRLTRLTNAFQQEVGESVVRAVPALRLLQLLPGPYDNPRHARDGIGADRSRLDDRRIAGNARLGHYRTVMPRSASRSSTSRKLRANRWYSQTAWLMTSGGKRWRRYSDSMSRLSPTAVNLTMPRDWLMSLETGPLYIEPASPWENGFCESFNGKLRDECLNGEIFYSPTGGRWRTGARAAGSAPPGQTTRHRAVNHCPSSAHT